MKYYVLISGILYFKQTPEDRSPVQLFRLREQATTDEFVQ